MQILFDEHTMTEDSPILRPASVNTSPLLMVALKTELGFEEIEYGAVPPESRILTPCPTDRTCVSVSDEPVFVTVVVEPLTVT